MAGSKDRTAVSIQQSALSNGKSKTNRKTQTPNPKNESAKPHTARKKRQMRVGPAPRSNKIEFKEAVGKTLESVELWIESDEGNILLNFTDRTVLEFDLAPTYTVEAGYFDLKTGNVREIGKRRRFSGA